MKENATPALILLLDVVKQSSVECFISKLGSNAAQTTLCDEIKRCAFLSMTPEKGIDEPLKRLF